jgi:hypothetical protein
MTYLVSFHESIRNLIESGLPKVPRYPCVSNTTSSKDSRPHNLPVNLREVLDRDVQDPRFPSIFSLHNDLISIWYAFQNLEQIGQLLLHRIFAPIDHVRNLVSVE